MGAGDRGVPMGGVIGLPLLSVDRELGWIMWFWNSGFALCGFCTEDARGESGRSSLPRVLRRPAVPLGLLAADCTGNFRME